MLKFVVVAATLLYLVESQPVQQPIQSAKLRFKLSARGIPDKDDGFGTTDPYVEIFYTENGGTKEKRLGRTSTISDTENPEWGDVFEFDFDRSKGQRWHFKVKDHDNLREDDTAGKAWVIVEDYVDKGQVYTANLHKKGTITVRSADPLPSPALLQPQVQPGVLIAPQQPAIAQPAVQPAVLSPQPGLAAAPINPPRRLRFQLGARGLEDLDVIGTTDPYIKLYYTDDLKSADTAIGRTAPLTDTENPDFTEIFDFDYVPGKRQRWHFVILDDDSNRRDDEAGEAFVDVDEYVSKGENLIVNLNKKGQLIVKRA